MTVTAPDDTTAATATFLINPAVLASSAAPTPFYPLEQDGFRNAMRFTFRTNISAADTVRVVNSRDRAIRIAKVGALSGTASHSWVWHGRKNNGARVQPGVFRVHLVAVADERKLRGPVVVVRVSGARPAHQRVQRRPLAVLFRSSATGIATRPPSDSRRTCARPTRSACAAPEAGSSASAR